MRLVVLSDTHGCHRYVDVPGGDVLIHCGDAELDGFTRYNDFKSWFAAQPHQHKIFVPGNHDFEFQRHTFNSVLDYESNGIACLIDKELILDGHKFYGTPWTPTFMDWAYMKDDEDLMAHWENIPDDTEILITHGPAYGIKDCIMGKKKHLGSQTLSVRVLELQKLLMHFHGHIHTGNDDNKTSCNCSVLDEGYKLVNKVKVFELGRNRIKQITE